MFLKPQRNLLQEQGIFRTSRRGGACRGNPKSECYRQRLLPYPCQYTVSSPDQPSEHARLDKVGSSDELRRNTGKGTPVKAELVGMHMVKSLRA